MSSPQELYMAIPPVTRAWLTAAVIATVGSRFSGSIVPAIAFRLDEVLRFQVWRLVLNFAYFGRPSFPWVIQMIMLYRYGSALEDNPYPSGGGSYRGNIADYVFMLMFCGAVLLVVAWYLRVYFMASSLGFAVIYLWSKRNPETEVSFYMFRMKGTYLPLALIVWSFATGDDPTMDLLGLLAGHLFYFLVDALPNSGGTGMGGKKLIWTPSILYRAFGVQPTYAPAAYMGGGGAGGGAGGAPNAGRYFQGEGRVLGRG